MSRKLRVASVGPKRADTSIAKLPPKKTDPELSTQEHRAWRKGVYERAGYRCEWSEGGLRCTKAAPAYRLFADHIVERKDGGAPLDPTNGQALCYEHHTRKTHRARAERMARRA